VRIGRMAVMGGGRGLLVRVGLVGLVGGEVGIVGLLADLISE
jgi:hypothetical protein